MRNKQVIQAWIKGQRATTGRLSTDGEDLYSYDLKIGERLNKLYIVWNHRGISKVNGQLYKGVFVSQTTSNHVGEALSALEDGYFEPLRLLHPNVIKINDNFSIRPCYFHDLRWERVHTSMPAVTA